MWLVGVFALVVVAAATSLVAERKGQRPGMWFLLGLLFPVVALIAAAVVVDPREGSKSNQADLREALPGNTIAHGLFDHPGVSAHQLAEFCEQPMDEVLEHLNAMEQLGLATRNAAGRWHMTEQGRSRMWDKADT